MSVTSAVPKISIHAPRTGSDRSPRLLSRACADFNPRSPHGERLNSMRNMEQESGISIHAPRTGSDESGRTQKSGAGHISIHAPRTGSDRQASPRLWRWNKFQSTLPARGATIASMALSSNVSNFNPRSPHGERLFLSRPLRWRHRDFNPRSPHGERLRKVTILSIRIIDFAQKVYHKTVLLRISLAENAVILPEKPRNPVRTSLQKAGGLRFARAIRAAHPYSISSPSGA